MKVIHHAAFTCKVLADECRATSNTGEHIHPPGGIGILFRLQLIGRVAAVQIRLRIERKRQPQFFERLRQRFK